MSFKMMKTIIIENNTKTTEPRAKSFCMHSFAKQIESISDINFKKKFI
jgi:hypothetical protein